MKLVYLSSARIPDDWGHVIQIMKMCEAFANEGTNVELVVPYRLRTRREDPFTFVGAKKNFTLIKLPCIDLSATGEGKWLYWLRTLSFLVSARLYLLLQRSSVIYTRELSASLLFRDFVFEAHSVSPGMKKALMKARSVVAITSGIRDDLVKMGISEDRILVAPDAVDLRSFEHVESKKTARARLGLPDGKLALYIGRIDAWKGMDALYDAARSLQGECTVAVIGADAPAIPALTKRHPETIFIPFRPYSEVADNQAAADVLVLPNTGTNPMAARYTSPLKLFTYMASGIPIVASDIPSVREVLDETTAFLVTPDSPEALAEGIRFVLGNPEEAKKRSAHARRAVEAYTWDTRAASILSFV